MDSIKGVYFILKKKEKQRNITGNIWKKKLQIQTMPQNKN